MVSLVGCRISMSEVLRTKKVLDRLRRNRNRSPWRHEEGLNLSEVCPSPVTRYSRGARQTVILGVWGLPNTILGGVEGRGRKLESG